MTQPFKRRFARIVGKQQQVVVIDAVGGEQAEHGTRLQPFLAHDLLEHVARIVVQRRRGLADRLVTENRGILAVELPGVEEGHPVDVIGQHREVDTVVDAHAAERGLRRHVGAPVDLVAALARLLQRQLRCEPRLARMLLAAARILAARLFHEGRARVGLDQRLRDADRARRILDVDNRTVVLRLDLDGRVRR